MGKPAIPKMGQTLDQKVGENKVWNKPSPESCARYRRCLGKLAWMTQTREDLHIFVTYFACCEEAGPLTREVGDMQHPFCVDHCNIQFGVLV